MPGATATSHVNATAGGVAVRTAASGATVHVRAARLQATDRLPYQSQDAEHPRRLRADVGVLEGGRWADLIAVPVDPTQDVTVLESVPFVINGGVVVKQAD